MAIGPNGPDLAGFSQATTLATNQISPDGQGLAWNSAWNVTGLVSPLSNPFPVGSDGKRFLTPLKTDLGLIGKAGGTFQAFPTQHARQQRWRIAIERQLSSHDVIEASYEGTYASDININVSQSLLPSSFYNFDATRTTAASDNNSLLTKNVPNPFNLSNADYSSIQSSSPALYNWMRSQGIFTGTNRTVAQLMVSNPFINYTAPKPLGHARSHQAVISFTHRFSRGLTANVGWTGMVSKTATDFYQNWNPDDPIRPLVPYWVRDNNGYPNRIVATWVYDLPFGKGRPWVNNKYLDILVGGWTIAGSFLYQPGNLLTFTGKNNQQSVFFYGDPGSIQYIGDANRWFTNTGCVSTTAVAAGDSIVGSGACTAGFEKRSGSAPVQYQARSFPQYLDGIRGPDTRQWNARISRTFNIKERVKLMAAVDALNFVNRSYLGGVEMNPTNANFGKITSGGSPPNRFIQITGRVSF
jgi:hypothetical protein